MSKTIQESLWKDGQSKREVEGWKDVRETFKHSKTQSVRVKYLNVNRERSIGGTEAEDKCLV